jgi:hypothetical protein
MLRRFLLVAAAAASLGFGGAVVSAAPASAQGFYFGYNDGPRGYGPPPRHFRHGPPPRYGYDRPHRRGRDCERVRVRYFDGYGWRVRTERRCYRGW